MYCIKVSNGIGYKRGTDGSFSPFGSFFGGKFPKNSCTFE